ncbi:MAG: hypothetical protein AB4352_29190 [Hormoscilla sp.]
MKNIYQALDQLSELEGNKRILLSLLAVVALALLLLGAYILFRSYNFIGLATLLLIYFIFTFRESLLELFELKKSKQEISNS